MGRREKAIELALDALHTDGAHHKQWYLERIVLELDGALPRPGTYEEGIAP